MKKPPLVTNVSLTTFTSNYTSALPISSTSALEFAEARVATYQHLPTTMAWLWLIYRR